VACVAPVAMATHEARRALPVSVPHADAAANAARSALLLAGLTRDPAVLFDGTEDFLHQRYRAAAQPATADLLGRLRRAGLITSKSERDFAADWALRLRIKFGRLTDPVSQLSGGNQQKVVLAKWLGRQPSLLIVDEPTRGIDIATKAEVHRLLSQLAGNGVAILMISSELPEVLRVGDRILVMREGRLVAEYPRAEASEETIMSAATGQLQEQAP